MFSQWRTMIRQLNRYRVAYGGVTGMLKSPFFGIALLVTALNYTNWLTPSWPGRTEALIPSLLGFSLGTYAILFSIMSTRLKGALRAVPASEGVSWLEAINATFFHFIFVQVVALVWAFLYQGSWLIDLATFAGMENAAIRVSYTVISIAGSFIGMFLLVYSVLLIVASAIAIFRLALIKDGPG